jgi:arginyl-tRNA synthetase
MNVQQEIERRVSAAIGAALPSAADADPMVAPSQNEKFGDYQANFAMSLAKRLKRKPRDIAKDVIARLDTGDMLDEPEIAGPGFINLRLSRTFIETQLAVIASDDRLGVATDTSPKTIVVDFSAPNTCKPMHVGHIRSMVIGDAICRLLRLLGHTVVADNHLGDWGTQFGLLIMGYRRFGDDVPDTSGDPLERLVEIYKKANAAAEADEALREEARQELVKLQAGDKENLAKWKQYSRWSLDHFDAIYERAGVRFDETLGESSYNDMLPGVVEDLTANGLARKSDGAMVIFWDDDSLPPMIVQKRDGAFLYATTDLATVKYRLKRWAPDMIVYVTDGRQQLHFRQLFSAAERWGILDRTELRHVWFGTIMGADGKPFKTRSGDLVPLKEVFDEAERRATAVVREKNPDLADDEIAAIGRVVGLGAIKYADLSQNRQSDFVFNWDKMLAMQGNTAPYLQYAYARIRSIFRKGEADGAAVADAPLVLSEPAEAALGLKLLRLSEVLVGSVDDFRLNLIANYLYELSSVFTTFYEACPVLKSVPDVRAGRLRLCDLTARTLKTGLAILGIEVPERM